MIIRNASILMEDGNFKEVDIYIKGEKIESIKDNKNSQEDKDSKDYSTEENSREEIIDAKGKFLSYGFLDTHVHLREPGMTHKETIESGTTAALHGGFTEVFAMPNVLPMPDTEEKMISMYERAEKDGKVKVRFYSPISYGEKGEELVDFGKMKKAGAIGFTDDGRGLQSAGLMYDAMEKASREDFIIASHCEENSLIRNGYIHKGTYARENHHQGIMSSCEDVQIARDILLAGENNSRYHICHMSTKRGVDLLEMGKKWGLKVSGEVTPHHLLLDDSDLKEEGDFKMNPPLRDESDREALVEGLKKGIIEVIATDHAPHAPNEKSKGLARSPFGIIGLENAFSLIYTNLVITGKVEFKTIVDAMTKNPRRIFGLPGGEIREGEVADLTLIDLTKEYVIGEDGFKSLSSNTPFKGKKVLGCVDTVIIDGVIRLREGKSLE